MYLFYESAIRPLLERTEFKTLVEVGAEDGIHTQRLLPYVRSRRAHLHVIDLHSVTRPARLRCCERLSGFGVARRSRT